MCGLVALLQKDGAADWARAQAALNAIAHRGPDAQALLGISPGGQITAEAGSPAQLLLGFRRLAILDRTPGSDQPMRDPATGNLLVFNGEIYNFLELRAELEALGERFTQRSDTEVILAAYRVWGEACFARMNGMWALALYDARTRSLCISRDRMGVKPLYWCSDGSRLAFASEIRALTLAMGIARPQVQRALAFDFLAGARTDYTDETLWQGVLQVPPGACWRVAPGGEITRGRYHAWQAQDQTLAPGDDELRALFEDAVRLRLRADAPTVTLLSGGFDSSLTTWYAAAHADAPRTQYQGAFSYGYRDAAYAAYDETSDAAAFVAQLPRPVPHHIVKLDPVPRFEEILGLARAQELPFGTPSIIAGYRLYRSIRTAGFTVVLSSEGADECWGGYTRRYLPMLARDRLRAGKLREFAQLLRSAHLPPALVLNRLAWELPASMLQHLLRSMRPNAASIGSDFWREQSHRIGFIRDYYRQPLAAALRDELVVNAMPQILRFADRNSMAASVEARLPFMDYRLVQAALHTPVAQKLSPLGGKQILRRACASVLPERIHRAPKLLGFGHAEQHCVLQMPTADLLDAAPPEAWEYLDRARLTRALGQQQAHPLLWLPLSFIAWLTVWRQP